MIRSLIVAYDKNRGIGYKNSIPWDIPEDRNWFRTNTMYHCVIMGSNTWDSLPERYRPLPDRYNIVLSRKEKRFEGADYITDNIYTAINEAEQNGFYEVFFMGGAILYSEVIRLGLVDRIYLTEIQGEYLTDCFFPLIGNDFEELYENDIGKCKFKILQQMPKFAN